MSFFSVFVGMFYRRHADRLDNSWKSLYLLRSGQIQTTKEGFQKKVIFEPSFFAKPIS